MRLVYTTCQKEVAIGDKVHVHNSGVMLVTGIQKPHNPASTGRVYVKPLDGGSEGSYYPSVIGAEWIEREDRA